MVARMTDVYIATPTQSDYDALMRLAESAGYTWGSGKKKSATKVNNWCECKEETVVRLDVINRYLGYDEVDYYESEGRIIATIPNLAGITAIYKRVGFDWSGYAKPIPHSYPEAALDYIVEIKDEIMFSTNSDLYKALAVECKPKESGVMPEKVKLPRFMCDWLDQNKGILHGYPLTDVSNLDMKRCEINEVSGWLKANKSNQWKLIDALRYGYEPEPEPRWGVKAGNYYLSTHSQQINNFSLSLLDAKSYKFKGDAEGTTRQLGFGEVVDLNKEA